MKFLGLKTNTLLGIWKILMYLMLKTSQILQRQSKNSLKITSGKTLSLLRRLPKSNRSLSKRFRKPYSIGLKKRIRLLFLSIITFSKMKRISGKVRDLNLKEISGLFNINIWEMLKTRLINYKTWRRHSFWLGIMVRIRNMSDSIPWSSYTMVLSSTARLYLALINLKKKSIKSSML